MKPRLSIVTPSLNQGHFIERTIRSVLDQGYENLEYAIVDGGSTDETVEIIKRYEDRLAWWVSEPDQGQTDAINKGIERTTGEIVAYINSDDYYLPGAFEKATDVLAWGEATWMVGASRFVNENGEVSGVWSPEPPSSTELPPRGRHWWMLRPWGLPQPSTFWRRQVFDQIGGFRTDMHYAFDTEFNLRAAYAGLMPALSERELAVRVLHGEAKSAELEPFAAEAERFVEIFRPQLTAPERRRLAQARVMSKLWLYRPYFLFERLRGEPTGQLQPRSH